MVALGLAAGAAPDSAENLSAYLHSAGTDLRFEVSVSGARCAGCISKIESGVKALAGVCDARLNLSTGKLTVLLASRNADLGAILRRVRGLGYGAVPFEADVLADGNAREGRLLLHCLAVAGFATVFTMGLTDAIWYGADDLGPALRKSFLWIDGMVAVPATAYAGQPFFRSAFAALKKRATNMDVPISLALVLSLGLSLYETMHNGVDVYFDAAVMLTFLLLIGRYLDFRLRERARGAAQHLLAMQSQLARRLNAGGNVETVAAREIAPGDEVLLATGDRAPVNGTVKSATEADLSLVTGESLPVLIAAGGVLSAGAVVTGAPLILLATARADDSLVADLARLLEAGQQTRNLYVSLADRAARAYVPFVTGLALLIFLGWLAAGAPFALAITRAITILIITCPCALGLAVPAVQIAATSRLFGRGLFIKSGNALERLGQADYAVFDKTGTLTLGHPVLENVNEIAPALLQQAARLARASQHPLARALAAAAGTGPVTEFVREVAGSGLLSEQGPSIVRLGNAAWCGAAPGQGSELWFRDGDAPPIRFAFRDQIRPETRAMVSSLRQRGFLVEMLTGDRPEPAGEIAREAGITFWRAGIGPREKAARLEYLRAQGHRVVMVGDGINDAAAMALAHVSIAPGSAADVSQLAADMVLRGGSLSPLVEAIDVARKAHRLVLQNFAMALLYNLTAIPLAAMGMVTPLIAAATMAGSSMIVILNALRLADPFSGKGQP